MENGYGFCLRFMCIFVLLFVALATRVMAEGTNPRESCDEEGRRFSTVRTRR